MGTEVHRKTYLPGYYSMMDRNLDAGNGSWPLYHDDRTLKGGQSYNIFLPRPTIDGYLGYEKELLRQTILKHESIFRQQLHELHRLYKIQRDLMNEIKRQELHRQKLETSQSSLFSSCIPSEDPKKTWRIHNLSLVDSACGRASTSATDSIQSHISSIKGKIMQYGPVPLQNGLSSKDCETSELKCKKFPRRSFDLELPADEYINNEGEKLQERVFGVSGVQSYPHPHNSNYQRNHGGAGTSCCNGDVTRSSLHLRRTHGLTDLNEPILVDEASASDSLDIIGTIRCSREELRRQDLSVDSNSGFQCLAKEFTQNSLQGRDGRICLDNLQIEDERNQQEWLSCKIEAEQTKGNKNPFRQGFCSEDVTTPYEPLQVKPTKAHEPSRLLPPDQSKTEPPRKRTIFGFEISERKDAPSVSASYSPNLHPLVPQSNASNSESSSVSAWRKIPGSFCGNLVSIQEHSCSNTSAPLSKNSKTSIQSPAFIGDSFQVNGNLRSIPTYRAELSYKNGFCLGSLSESKELEVCCPSVGYDYVNGLNNNNSASEQFAQHGPLQYAKGSGCIDVKPVKDINMDVASHNSYRNEVICQQDSVFTNEQRKQEKPRRELPWLRGKPLCGDESFRQGEDSYQMTLDSLKNHPWQVVNKTEMGNGPSHSFIQDFTQATCAQNALHKMSQEDDCLSNRKILGVPIFTKSHISKDLSSLSSPSKSTCLTSAINGVNTRKDGLLTNDFAHDPISPKSGEQLRVKGLAVEKRLTNEIADFRHHIDLNLCIIEEEAPSRHSSPRSFVNISAKIDLEAPVVLETEEGISPREESLDSQIKLPSELSESESRMHHEGFIREEAEAIVAISMSHVYKLSDNATCHPSVAALSDTLYWFADIISSYKDDPKNDVSTLLMGKDGARHGEFVTKGVDYFEFMTLMLTETKVEEHCFQPQALEGHKDEKPMPRRTRRGQARRGRQRMDFQRVVLPGLASLSKHEVTEDLRTFESLIRANGCTWQSGFAQRNTTKGGGGRGRRHSGSSASSLRVVCPPAIEQSNCGEVGLEEKSLTGWGKRTRRPPRQRCPVANSPCSLK